MRTLEKITEAARTGAEATEEELRLAICAYDVLLAFSEVEKHVLLLQEFFKAAEMEPRAYIGENNSPDNVEFVEWYKAMKTVGSVDESYKCEACDAEECNGGCDK